MKYISNLYLHIWAHLGIIAITTVILISFMEYYEHHTQLRNYGYKYYNFIKTLFYRVCG